MIRFGRYESETSLMYAISGAWIKRRKDLNAISIDNRNNPTCEKGSIFV